MAKVIIDKKFIDFEKAIKLYFSFYIKDDAIEILKKALQNQAPKKDNSLESLIQNDITSYMAANKYNLERETLDKIIEDIKDKIFSSQKIKNDLNIFKDEFKDLAINKIREQKYDKASSLIHKDLSLDYIERRIEELLEDEIASLNAPSSSVEYLINRLNNESLFSFISKATSLDNKTLKEEEIQEKALQRYNPSLKEKALSTFGVTLFDALTLSPGSIQGVLSSAMIDIGGNLSKELILSKEDKPLTPNEYLSIVLFNTKEDVFNKISKEIENSSYSSDFSFLNEKLENKITEYHPTLLKDLRKNGFIKEANFFNASSDCLTHDVPMVILEEEKKEYLESENKEILDFLKPYIGKELIDKATGAKIIINEVKKDHLKYSLVLNEEKNEKDISLSKAYNNIKTKNWLCAYTQEKEINASYQNKQISKAQEKENESKENSFFSLLLSSFGLDSLDNTFQNLPYILATLPDTLLGTIKGSNNAIDVKRDILPLSFFTLGIIIKNPILKALFLGFGGINLLSKLGNNSLEEASKKYKQNHSNSFIKEYKDEKLDYRLKDVRIKDNKFIVTINNTPYFTTLPDITAKAYKEGKLPLNTLANAVFNEYQRQSSLGLLPQVIASSRIKENENQKESITLSR